MAPPKFLDFAKNFNSTKKQDINRSKVGHNFDSNCIEYKYYLFKFLRAMNFTLIIPKTFQEGKPERKTPGKSGHVTFNKKFGKETTEKESNSSSSGATSSFPSHGILSKLKNQALLNPRSKLRHSHDILREKVSKIYAYFQL